MTDDLKIIKKKYGEEMMHFCREAFATILENPGVLSSLLLTYFEPSKELFADLEKANLEDDFKDFIYQKFNREGKLIISGTKTPQELLASVGYDLYECHSEKDIQKFKKYYEPDEELCTFNGGRLNQCYVFFAVKKDVDNIKRENFKKPQRQDLYGTSVISIQFDKNDAHTLSIKNRYNHTVTNPDATFSNNLDNIVEGLTDSFALHYNLKQAHITKFDIPEYTRDNQGKYYKYNYEMYGTYYGTNNIIIDYRRAIRYPKERYILADYFIIDRQEKTIKCYRNREDGFISMFKKTPIKKIDLENQNDRKIVKIETIKGTVTLELDQENKIISLIIPYVKEIGDNFMFYNKWLKAIDLPKVRNIGSYFLNNNVSLETINLPNVITIGQDFLRFNKILNQIDIPKVKSIAAGFLQHNEFLEKIALPNVKKVPNHFLDNNIFLQEILLPQATKIGCNFLQKNENLETINLPNVKTIDSGFMNNNKKLRNIKLPKCEEISYNFLYSNLALKEIVLPQVKKIGFNFLHDNVSLTKVDLSQAEIIGSWFLNNNEFLTEINLPSVKNIYEGFLYSNKVLKRIDMPYVTEIGKSFLPNDRMLQVINVLDENIYHQILKEHINLYTLKQILLEMKKSCSNTLKLQKKHR